MRLIDSVWKVDKLLGVYTFIGFASLGAAAVAGTITLIGLVPISQIGKSGLPGFAWCGLTGIALLAVVATGYDKAKREHLVERHPCPTCDGRGYVEKVS